MLYATHSLSVIKTPVDLSCVSEDAYIIYVDSHLAITSEFLKAPISDTVHCCGSSAQAKKCS